ncbi:hypothetical protein PHYSODRAFT_336900 [Phytophthora sojae]|uniref:Uncharacterized protein n=1 Tax=Phytophthora sojae (strain P6497) TaxID=1094619 RepID=G4ZX02_PHYSP|nr:hypothetical protein PHYSODRAFT_336900 [Phytophthora sojae]EGZ12472.1 hypothetical protein PHYSODRAFT_336900 [Phytophthora sojae]|eukprot:XP_009532805.1 hypothetical protein PHYSODRAFT_336900 [Phytophthora sojae]
MGADEAKKADGHVDTDIEMEGDSSSDKNAATPETRERLLETAQSSTKTDAVATLDEAKPVAYKASKPIPVQLQQKRARANTEAELQEVAPRNQGDGRPLRERDAATHEQHRRVLKQLSGRRQKKILRQGSKTQECSVASLSPTKQQAAEPKALKQQSLFDAFAGERDAPHLPSEDEVNKGTDLEKTEMDSGPTPSVLMETQDEDEDVECVGENLTETKRDLQVWLNAIGGRSRT